MNARSPTSRHFADVSTRALIHAINGDGVNGDGSVGIRGPRRGPVGNPDTSQS